MEKNVFGKYMTLYFYFIVFFLPLVFVQKCEDAYYLPKFALLAGAIQFYIPLLFNARRLKFNLVDYSALIFFVLFAMEILFIPFKNMAYMRLAEWSAVLGAFFYARHFMKPQEIKRALLLMLLSSFFVALYAFMQALNMDLSGWLTNFSGRAFSSLGNPDFLGGFLVLAIPVSLYLSRGMGREKTSTALFSFLIITLLLSQTRSSIAAFAASFVIIIFMFPGYFKKNYIFLIMGAAAAVVLILITGSGAALISRFSAAATSANPDLQGRFDMWQTGLNMFVHNPLIGTGAGSVKNVYCAYANAGTYLETDHLHNDFIEIAAESGVFVWAAFMVFLCSVFYALLKRKDTLSKIGIAVFAAMCVQAFFNFPFFVLDSKLYFFAIIGLALNRQDASQIQNKGGLFAGLVGLVMVVIILRLFVGSLYLNAGINSTKNSQTALHYLEKAEKYYYDAKPLYYFAPPNTYAGSPENAVKYSKKYMEAFPCSKNGYMQHSINMAEKGSLNEAMDTLDSFLKMYPTDKDALNNKGRMLYMAGRTAEAVELYKDMVAKYPTDEIAHNNLYGIYYNGKMFKEAQLEKDRWELKGK